MVVGTIRYSEQDFALSQSAFSEARPVPLWQATVAIGCLGAVAGLGIATLLSEAVPMLSQHTAWGAACGAILMVGAGAWRISAKPSPMQTAMLQLQQAFQLDEDGFRLSTETAETHMKWAHFLVARIEPDLMVLRTRDETIVLLRRDFLADQADWNEAERLVGAYVSAPSDA